MAIRANPPIMRIFLGEEPPPLRLHEEDENDDDPESTALRQSLGTLPEGLTAFGAGPDDDDDDDDPPPEALRQSLGTLPEGLATLEADEEGRAAGGSLPRLGASDDSAPVRHEADEDDDEGLLEPLLLLPFPSTASRQLEGTAMATTRTCV